MWNEKKFFKDYVQSAEKIQPDSAYIEQLKANTNTENLNKSVQKRRKKMLSCLAVAASFALIIFGSYGIGLWGKITPTQTPSSLSANNGEDELSGNVAQDNPELYSVLSMLSDTNNMVDNKYGGSISDTERNHLISLLKSCTRLDTPKDVSLAETVYYCVGDDTIKIIVYEDQFIVINDIMYEVKE